MLQNNATHKPLLVKLGCQRYGAGSDSILQFYERHGVQHIASGPDGSWTTENIRKMRKRAESYGINVLATHIPLSGNILLADAEQRDQRIKEICDIIQIGADGGYSMLFYNLGVHSWISPRTEPTLGRGGVSYSTWNIAKADLPQETGDAISEKVMWEKITYLLEKVIPVAEKCKIFLACHPPDPPVPLSKGIPQVLATVEGLKKFVEIIDSDYHGLHFCQGTLCEMLQEPEKEIYDIIQWFGERKKIINVHFRNIRGKRNGFYETYPDEGDIDMLKAMRVYKEVGYGGMIMPDHLPNHPDDPQQHEGFAFAYGYIRALMQAVS